MNMGYHSNLSDICKNIADFIFTLDVLQFFNNDKKIGYTCSKRSFGKPLKSYSLRGVSGVLKSVRRIP